MSNNIWGEPEDSVRTEGQSDATAADESVTDVEPEAPESVSQKRADNEGHQTKASVTESSSPTSSKEWRLIERMVSGLHKEQRVARRWGIFFKSLTFLYLFAILMFAYQSMGPVDFDDDLEPHTAVIDVNGAISAGSEASADIIVSGLREAFKNESAAAVVLRINSPGGSPVQSGYIYDEIMRLKALDPSKPVYAVISDVGASGAYYIAAAADEIYADKASLVGSIGVVAGGFGFVDLIEKLGVERRLYISGENKAFLDPFLPQNEESKQKWQQVLSSTHEQFINAVKAGRGDRLSDDPELFSGMVWNGEQALEIGLIDGLGSTSFVAREVIGVEKIFDYSYRPDPLSKVLDRIGVSFAGALVSQMKAESGYELR